MIDNTYTEVAARIREDFGLSDRQNAMLFIICGNGSLSAGAMLRRLGFPDVGVVGETSAGLCWAECAIILVGHDPESAEFQLALAHEICHALCHAWLDARRAPPWVLEGYAHLVESSLAFNRRRLLCARIGVFCGVPRERGPLTLRALLSIAELPVELPAQWEFRYRASAFLEFLRLRSAERPALWSFVEAALSGRLNTPVRAVEALEAAASKQLVELDREFVAHCASVGRSAETSEPDPGFRRFLMTAHDN